MNEERDWDEEGKKLYVIYCRRGYQKERAYDMAQREIEKRKIECGYPVETEETQDRAVGEKVKLKTVKSQKKRAKK
jgi:hypothetical protein